MDLYRYEILSGIPLEEIKAFFRTRCIYESSCSYEHQQWKVRLYPLDNKTHGMITLPQTRIEFVGEKTSCVEIIEAYRKAFMRGGA